jgi:hypothetical protein
MTGPRSDEQIVMDAARRTRSLQRISRLLLSRKAHIEHLCPRFGYLHCYVAAARPGCSAKPMAEDFMEKVEEALAYGRRDFDAILSQLRRLGLGDCARELSQARIRFRRILRERATRLERSYTDGGGDGGGCLCVDDPLTSFTSYLGAAAREAASVTAEQLAGAAPAGTTQTGDAPKKQKPAQAEVPGGKSYTFGPNYRSANWYDQPYSFSPREAEIVEILAEAYDAGVPDVDAGALLGLSNDERRAKGKKESYAHRVRDIFRDNPAWGTMIVPGKGRGKKGTYHLNPPHAAV